MQLSRFVLTYRDVRPHEHVLYDVINDRYVGVDDATLEAVARWSSGPPSGGEEADVQKALRENGFLVEAEGEDDERLRAFLEAAAEGMPGTMYVTLMPTLQCDLACSYCFQKDHPAFTQMKAPTEAATVEWVLRKVDQAASRKLLVHYFGGEPLTRKDYLLRTAEVFSSAMLARGAVFEWEITTNGVGLDVDFARTMRKFGEGSIKVTLDGDKETHDTARVYRDGRGSFDRIYGNVLEVVRAVPDVKMRLGGNFRPEQVASYEKLLARLSGEELSPGAFEQIRFKPIIEASPNKSCTSCTSCGSKAEADATMRIADSVDRTGLSRKKTESNLPPGPCELHWKNSYIIDPEGRVYKCPAVAGMPELAVASVKGAPVERIAPLLELRPWEKCGPCPYLPVCVGGCLGGKYLETRKRDEVFCRKEHFEQAFKKEIALRYLAEFAPESSDLEEQCRLGLAEAFSSEGVQP